MSGEEAVVLAGDAHRGLMKEAVSPAEIMGVMKHLHATVRDAMVEGKTVDGKWNGEGDFAILPGTQKKTLLKPGAEKLLLAFGLLAIPREPRIVDLGGGHREVTVLTEIRSMRTNLLHAIGMGSCSTLESRYRYRGAAGRECPKCGAIACKPSKKEYGGGFYCDSKAGGCGTKFSANSEEGKILESTPQVKEENPDLADLFNTVLKMASKRSMIDGVLRATSASGLFTQDLDDQASQDRGAGAAKGTGQGQARSAPQGDPGGAAADPRLESLRKKTWAKCREAGIAAAELRTHISEIYQGAKFDDLNTDQIDALLTWIDQEKERRNA